MLELVVLVAAGAALWYFWPQVTSYIGTWIK
jgi:hypothetical protein